MHIKADDNSIHWFESFKWNQKQFDQFKSIAVHWCNFHRASSVTNVSIKADTFCIATINLHKSLIANKCIRKVCRIEALNWLFDKKKSFLHNRLKKKWKLSSQLFQLNIWIIVFSFPLHVTLVTFTMQQQWSFENREIVSWKIVMKKRLNSIDRQRSLVATT